MSWTSFLPAMSAAFFIVAAIITYGGRLVSLARDAKKEVEDLRSDVRDMKPKVDMILVLQQSVSDGKAWMDRMERRIEGLESRK